MRDRYRLMDEEELQVSPELDMSTINSKPELPTVSEDPDIREKLKGYFEDKYAMRDARSVESRDQLLSALGKGMNQIVGGLTRSTPDNSYYDDLSKNASAPVSAVEKREKAIRDYLQAKMDNETRQKGLELQIEMLRRQMQKDEDEKRWREGEPHRKAKQEVNEQAAKKYGDYVLSGGAEAVEAGASRAEKMIKDLETSPEEDSLIPPSIRARAGELVGKPNLFLSAETLKIKQDVVNAALPLLKSTLGPQISNADLIAMAESWYDPKVSKAANVLNMKAKAAEAANKGRATADAMKHYEQRGFSMDGYRGLEPKSQTTATAVDPSANPSSVPPDPSKPPVPGAILQKSNKGNYRWVTPDGKVIQ